MYLTISDVITYLFPEGTSQSQCILKTPRWPADLFGATAYIAEKSDCYAELLDFASDGIGTKISNEQIFLEQVGSTIAEYPYIEGLPQNVQDFLENHWQILARCTDPLVYDQCADRPDWIFSTLCLLIVADIACEGIGFHGPHHPSAVGSSMDPEPDWIPRVYSWMSFPQFDSQIIRKSYQEDDWYHRLSGEVSKATPFPKYAPMSACWYIPEDRLCVLPKSLTPNVGCTIRSLTKNLSLHPGYGQVKSQWYNHEFDVDIGDIDHLNVLVVPYPYKVSSTSFAPSKSVSDNFNVFKLHQNWLDGKTEFYGLIKSLYLKAQMEQRPVDILIFPELALDVETFVKVLEMVAELAGPRLTLVVAGVMRKDHSGRIRNCSATAYVKNGEKEDISYQDKHHRWKLDASQVKTYGLEKALPATITDTGDWWEESDVSERTVKYHVFQRGACFATLICEDLARQDPCKNTLQATGPNLVFALLMDAPQLERRWPGRYTLGLTEDPGSSVLTVTSLGLVERSNWTYNGTRQTIALWGNHKGVREIDLPVGYQGVILSLKREELTIRTIDNRSGMGAAWDLISITPVKMD